MKTGGARKAGGCFPWSAARRVRLPASTGAGAHAGRAGRGATGPRGLTKHSAASSMRPSWKRCSSRKLSASACRTLSEGRAFSRLCWNCANMVCERTGARERRPAAALAPACAISSRQGETRNTALGSQHKGLSLQNSRQNLITRIGHVGLHRPPGPRSACVSPKHMAF